MADFLELEILGNREILRNLDQMPATVRAIVLEKTRSWIQQIHQRVLENMAARLQMKTGDLERALRMEVSEDGGRVMGRVYIDTEEAPHARAQEKGAVIPAHIIRPRNAKILAFYAASGDKVFALHVLHPGATIPGKWFMRDAYREIAPQISRGLKKAVVDGIRANMRRG